MIGSFGKVSLGFVPRGETILVGSPEMIEILWAEEPYLLGSSCCCFGYSLPQEFDWNLGRRLYVSYLTCYVAGSLGNYVSSVVDGGARNLGIRYVDGLLAKFLTFQNELPIVS